MGTDKSSIVSNELQKSKCMTYLSKIVVTKEICLK